MLENVVLFLIFNYKLINCTAEAEHIACAVDTTRKEDSVTRALADYRFNNFKNLFTPYKALGKIQRAHIVESFSELEYAHRFKSGSVLRGINRIGVSRWYEIVAG